MKAWEKAVETYLKPWKKKKEVIGITICGSYITGNPSNHSDIDLRITMSNNVTYRKRENKMIDGFLIEAMINPLKREYEYFEEEYLLRKRHTAHMFSSGKVIVDTTGKMKELVKEAKEWNKKPFKKMKGISTSLNAYALWDLQDNLEEVYERNSQEFDYVYYNALQKLLETYCAFLGYDNIPIHRVKQFLTNKKQREKYSLPKFPDTSFVTLFTKAAHTKEKEKRIKHYQKLTKHVLDKMGFKGINGWKVKSDL